MIQIVLILCCLFAGFQANVIDKVCAPGSLDKLHLAELLERSDECSDEVRKVFESKYSTCAFKIHGPIIDDDNLASITEEGSSIEVNSIIVTKNILTQFGALIGFLQVDFEHLNAEQAKDIVKSINDAKMKTLRLFNLLNCKGHALDELKGTFPQVNVMKFYTSETEYFEFSNTGQTLYKLFPKLRRFFVVTKATEWTIIDGKFPNLKYFHVFLATKLERDKNGIDETHVSSFLKKNKQIEELSIGECNLNVLSEANNILPHLKSLEINTLSEDYENYQGDDAIHFKTVRELTVKSDVDNEIPVKIKFDQVYTLTLNLGSTFTDKWKDFIGNQVNSKVNTLNLHTKSVTTDQLMAIADKLIELENVVVGSQLKYTADNILNFVMKLQNLQSLQLNIEMEKTEQVKLTNTLTDDWTVTFPSSGSDGKVIIGIERDGDDSGALATFSGHVLIVILIFSVVHIVIERSLFL